MPSWEANHMRAPTECRVSRPKVTPGRFTGVRQARKPITGADVVHCCGPSGDARHWRRGRMSLRARRSIGPPPPPVLSLHARQLFWPSMPFARDLLARQFSRLMPGLHLDAPQRRMLEGTKGARWGARSGGTGEHAGEHDRGEIGAHAGEHARKEFGGHAEGYTWERAGGTLLGDERFCGPSDGACKGLNIIALPLFPVMIEH